jgi:hypothetical protein
MAVDLAIRGSWRISGFMVLILLVSDVLAGRILRNRSETSVLDYSRRKDSRFFRFYSQVLLAGGVLWLAVGFRRGITWTDLVVFTISVLLAVAMLSIGRRMNAPTGQDQSEGRQSRLP